MMRGLSKGLAMTALLAGTIAAGSIALAPSAALAGKDDDTLNAAFLLEVTTLDHYKETGREGLIVSRHLYDNLLYKDWSTGEIVPALAKSYAFIDDTTIEFKLNEGVKFHNGAVMTADDVVYTLNLVSSPEYNARYQIAVAWIEKAEKIDDHTVRLHMKSPYPLALEMLAGNLPIYPKAYYEEVGPDGMGVRPVGTGPYRLLEMTPGTRFVMERFDDYYAESPKGRPAIKNLIVRVLPEPNTQYAEMLNGRLDWIWKIPPDEAANLDRSGRVQVKATPIMRIAYINLNPTYDEGNSPLANLKVRQAIHHAINRQAIVDAFVGGGAELIHTVCNPIQFGCTDDVTKYPYDLERARTLMAEAGYPDGFDMELVVSGTPRPQVEAIAADLAKIGIDMSINEQQWASATDMWRGARIAMRMGNWGSYGIGDIGLITSHYFGDSDENFVRDPEVIEWLQIGDTSVDPAERKKNYAKALKRISEGAFWVPLWTFNVNYALSPDLDFTLDPDEFARWFKAEWK